MPVIAVTRTSKIADYIEAVRQAGGEPRVVDAATDSAADVIARASGLLLTGGGDVLPALYGAATGQSFSPAEPGRDEFELELVRRALGADIPVFAICRGIQVLNVAAGGTLVQDIPTETAPGVAHEVRTTPDAIAHEISVTPGSLLGRLLDPQRSDIASCRVNSRHHQAPNAIGAGLVASAVAPDGVIEALEAPDRRFCLGVQWHPENFWQTGEFSELFEGFVSACRRQPRKARNLAKSTK